MPIIEIKNITCGYENKDVIRDFSLNVESGDFFGIVGPNGSGKTTLMLAITDVIKIKSGDIYFNGKNKKDFSKIELAKFAAFVPHFLEIPFSYSVEEFISFGRYPHLGKIKVLSDHDYAIIDKFIDILDLKNLQNKNLKEISSGEFQKVLICQGLVQEPKVLILDEPTAHLDVNHRYEIMDILSNLNKCGLTIITILHDLDLSKKYCSNIMTMKKNEE